MDFLYERLAHEHQADLAREASNERWAARLLRGKTRRTTQGAGSRHASLVRSGS